MRSVDNDVSTQDLKETSLYMNSMIARRPGLSAGMAKRIPKIKVNFKSKEFTVLTAIMDQINN